MPRLALSILALFALAAIALAPNARAQGLVEGNAIAVTAPDGIYILDPTGQIREKLDFVAGEPSPCWLPNGNLLVADGFGNLVEINPITGAIIREIALGEPVTGMTMGAAGLLYVTTPVALVVLDLSQKAGDEIVDVIEIAGGVINPCWLPNGHIMVAVIPPPGTEGFEGLREIDPASGATIREIAVAGINDFVRDPVSGDLFVATDFAVARGKPSDGEGGGYSFFEVFGEPTEMVGLLPDNSLGAITTFDGIQVIDPETGELLRTIAEEIKDPTGFAVAPFHLETEIIGQLVEPPNGAVEPLALDPLLGLAPLDIRENATLIYANTGMIVILLDQGAAGIIAPMFDTGIVSLTGFDIPINAERGLHGAQVPPAGSAAPFASMAGIAEGDHDPLFNYTVREIEGSLHLAGIGGVFQGKIKAKNKAKPR